MELRPRVIDAPPRLDPVGSVLVFSAMGAYAVALLVPLAWQLHAAAIVACAVALVTLVGRRPYAVHTTLLMALITSWLAYAGLMAWPLYFLVPLLAWGAASARVRPLRHSVGWLRCGVLDRVTAVWMVAVVVLSSSALAAWLRWAHADVRALAEAIPAGSTGVLLATGLGFALLNALMEEAIWRGVLLEGLDAAVGPGALAVLVQGVSFGVAHIGGFPRGAMGVAMAGVFGVMQGALRRRSRGMLAPVITHVVADGVVFVLVWRVVHSGP